MQILCANFARRKIHYFHHHCRLCDVVILQYFTKLQPCYSFSRNCFINYKYKTAFYFYTCNLEWLSHMNECYYIVIFVCSIYTTWCKNNNINSSLLLNAHRNISNMYDWWRRVVTGVFCTWVEWLEFHLYFERNHLLLK